jgi:hypothetical protein
LPCQRGRIKVELTAARIPPSGRTRDKADSSQDFTSKVEQLKKSYQLPGFLLREQFEKQLPTASIALPKRKENYIQLLAANE